MKHLHVSSRGFAVRASFQGRQYYFGEYQHQHIAEELAQELDQVKKRATKKAQTDFEDAAEKAKEKAKALARELQSSDGISRLKRGYII
jgi:exonuclease VII large subunit